MSGEGEARLVKRLEYSSTAINGEDLRFSRIRFCFMMKVVTPENLNIRLFNRRFTRLTLGYSKKLENLRHSVALFVCYWNFCWKHTTTGQTPAQASKLTDHAWTVAELLEKISAI
jgi:hypothetical protein